MYRAKQNFVYKIYHKKFIVRKFDVFSVHTFFKHLSVMFFIKLIVLQHILRRFNCISIVFGILYVKGGR